jgi:hypothetical protein
MSNQVRIKTDELPLRARNLAPDETSRVFGGCDPSHRGGGSRTGGPCSSDKDCCPGWTCPPFLSYSSERFLGIIPIQYCSKGFS